MSWKKIIWGFLFRQSLLTFKIDTLNQHFYKFSRSKQLIHSKRHIKGNLKITWKKKMFEPISRYISGPSIFTKIWNIHLHTFLLCITFLLYLFSFRRCDHQKIPYTHAQTNFQKSHFWTREASKHINDLYQNCWLNAIFPTSMVVEQ